MYVFISFGEIPRSGTAVAFGKRALTIVRNLFPKVAASLLSKSLEALVRSDKDSFKGLRVCTLETQLDNTHSVPKKKENYAFLE